MKDKYLGCGDCECEEECRCVRVVAAAPGEGEGAKAENAYVHDWTVRDWTKFHGVRDIANHRLERGVKVDSCN